MRTRVYALYCLPMNQSPLNQTPGELRKLLQHIDQLIAQAPDEPTRAELQGLKARLNTPEMLDMARDLAGSRPSDPESPMIIDRLPTIVSDRPNRSARSGKIGARKLLP